MSVWTEETLTALVEARVPESVTLELKSSLPGRSDRDRAEFLKDVSALANAAGGYILYGIAEDRGSASSFSGLDLSDFDGELRRLSQMLDTGVEPRLGGVQFRKVSTEQGDVLAVQVPESFDNPHRYTFNGHSKFVQRTGTHISELSYDQLRAAFSRSSGRLERLRAAWERDLSLDHTWKPMIDGPVCVVRLSPLLSAEGRQTIDPKKAYENWSELIFPGWGGGSSSFNYDGLAVYPGRDDSLPAMTQVYRTGALTAFRTGRILIDDRPLIPSTTVGDFFIDAATRLLSFAQRMGLAGSAVLNAGLVRLKGYSFAARDRYGFDEDVEAPIDRILMPDFWIEDLGHVESIDSLMRPGFDLLWQAFGRSGCPLFNQDGRWAPNQR